MVKKQLIKRAELARKAGVSAASVTKACNKSLKEACVGKKVDLNHPAVQNYIARQEEEPTSATGFDSKYEDAIVACRGSGRYSQNFLCTNLHISKGRAKRILALMDAAGVIPSKDEPPPIIKKPRVVKGHTVRNTTKKQDALSDLNDKIENGSTLHEIPEDIEKFADMTLRELILRFGSDAAFADWLKSLKTIEEINERRLKNAATKGKLVSRDLIKRGIIEPIDAAHIKLLTDGAKAMAVRASALVNAGESIEVIEKYISGQITSFIRPVKNKIKKAMAQK